MERTYTNKRLNKDMRFIELESRVHPKALTEECGPICIRIKIPYDSSVAHLHDQPERVIKAFLEGHYDIDGRK